MTKKPKGGTLSTSRRSDKKGVHPEKEKDVIKRLKSLLGQRERVKLLAHANERMGQRNVLYYEVLQALSRGKHDPSGDRYSKEFESWQYSIEGKTMDDRLLRIGISFEVDVKTGERLLIITVIEPGK